MNSQSFSVTGALFSALLTAWYVAATPEPDAQPTVVIHGVAVVHDALGLPHVQFAHAADHADSNQVSVESALLAPPR